MHGRTCFPPAQCSTRWPPEPFPFQGDTSAVIFDAILNREPRPAAELNPALPADFVRILEKILEKDRNLRCQTATELKTDLNRLKRDLESSARRAREKTDSDSGVAEASEKIRGRSLL